MGQRHQIYVVSKKKNQYNALGAFHHQWCYGLRAASNIVRLANAASKAKIDSTDQKWVEYSLRDSREIDVLVKAIYGIDMDGTVSMVHNESEYLIEEGSVRPERGDNNDGAALLIIDDDEKEIRVCMFTPGHVEGNHNEKCKAWKPYSPTQYLDFYYDSAKRKEIGLDPEGVEKLNLINQPLKTIGLAEFKKIMAAALKAESAAS